LLLDKGSNPLARDEGGSGRTPLQWAKHKQHDGVTKLLQEATSRAIEEEELELDTTEIQDNFDEGIGDDDNQKKR